MIELAIEEILQQLGIDISKFIQEELHIDRHQSTTGQNPDPTT
ncbi:hypothetical protein J2736_006749 [Paenibacillus qinlingensis]|uniref:Uncharacterized protein n=1 Tax=Paenibacillus qinlingensis TaxID=1837343 RepID=A0ABU1P8V4_9BACL|nr:hypothetical protein [Paenibacillus qinlingensis]